MNAFVRDGAVNRKRRVRPSSSTHRSIDPGIKKIRKTDYDNRTATQSDLQLNFDENMVYQSTSVAIETEKESRYSNADFIRTKAFLYLKFKKIKPANVNKALKEHLKKFDKEGTQLKKIFEQCYGLTKGSVEKSESMMKELETNSCVLLTNVLIGDRLLNNSCKEVVKKSVKRNNITKDKKLMPLSLKQRIDDKILKLFGNFHSKNDRKIVYSNTIFHTLPENDISHDKTCRITKSYSIRNTQNDFFKETKISKPNANSIIRDHHISCINNSNNVIRQMEIPQLTIDRIILNAKEAVSETNIVVEKYMTPQLKIDVAAQNTRNSAAEIVHNVEEIMIPHINMDEIDDNAKELGLETNIIVEEITVPQLIMDKCVNNVKDSAFEITSDGGEIMIPRLRIDETIQNTKEVALEIVDDDDEEIMYPRLIIDETVESNKESELKIAEEITIPQLIMDKCVNNVKDSAFEIASDGGEIMIPQLRIDETIQNSKESALEIVDDDDGENMSPRLIIDETVESIKESELKIAEEITVPQLIMNKCVNNVKDSAFEIASDGGEIMIPRLRIDENIQNTKEVALEIVDDDDEEIMYPRLIIDETVESIKESELKIAEEITIPQLIMDKCVNNVKDSAFEIASDGGEIMIPQLRIDENIQNTKEVALEIVDDNVGEIMVPQLKMDGNIENTKSSVLETNIDVINEIENTNDMNQQPETLKHFINVVLEIEGLIDPDDEIFKNSIIKDLATYFLNNDFLSKIENLFNTTESDLISELIVKLLDMFNDSQYNMAQFSGCLICVFREIALKSSIPPCKMKLKLFVFLDAIKRYIKIHDYGLYRSWFLSNIFFDWCFFVAYIFMNTNKDFIIDLNNESIVNNATSYYKMVKQSKYLFINQNSQPKKALKKSGIFELTRIDDLLELDGVHTKKSNNQVIPNISINIPFKEPKHNKLKTKNENENCMEINNLTIMDEDKKKECSTPDNSKIHVNPKFNISNSFIKPLNWFDVDVTELRNQLNATISNESNESSIVVQNNTTDVDNNIQPIAINLGSEVTSVKNKARKRKKSTQVESPRVYFTIANNPKQFNLTYGSSVVAQSFSSSTNPQNTNFLTIPQNASPSRDPQNASMSKVSPSSSSSTNPQNTSVLAIPQNASPSRDPQNTSFLAIPRSSTSSKVPRSSSSSKNLRKSSSLTISHNESLLTIPQNPYSPTVLQNSSSSTIPTSRSSYNNNILSNTQYPETLQTVIRQNPYSSTVPQNSSSLTLPQRPRSSTVPRRPKLSAVPRRPKSSAVPQDASLLTIPQNSYSPTVPTNRSSYYNNILSNTQYPETMQTVLPQSPYSSSVPQNSSSLAFPQHSSLSTVPTNRSSYHNNILSNTQYPETMQTVIPQSPYSSSVPQNPSSLTLPQRPTSSAVSQNASLLTIHQNPYSPTVHQNSSSLTIPQHLSSSAVPTNRSSYHNNILSNTQYPETMQTVIPQSPYSSSVPQNPSSLTLPQLPTSSAVSQNASLLTIHQNPYSPTVHQNSSSLTIPQHLSSSAVPTNRSSYHNNILSNTQYPETMQTVIPQSPYSSSVPQNPSSLTLPQLPTSLAVSQNASLLTIHQNPYSPTVHQNSSSLTIPQHLSSSAVPQNLSPYYNNFSSNNTQIPIGFRKDSPISNTTQISNSKSTHLPMNNSLQSSISTLPPVSSNTWPPNLYHHSNTMNALCSMGANTHWDYAHYTRYMGFTQSNLQSLYNENIPFTTSQHLNAPIRTTNPLEPISRNVVGNTQTTSVPSISNAYIQKLNDKYNNFNHGSSLVNQNNLQTLEYNPQVSPDLPDARLPNMPNLQDSDTRNKMCMAANCTNISCFRCEYCMAAVYCSTQCQITDLHYHKNECRRF